MPTISAKSLGNKRPLFAEFSIALPRRNDGGEWLLRELIDHIVRGGVAAFQERQQARMLVRTLTARDIAAGEAHGRIISGGSEFEPQAVDANVAVETALQAFEDGMYLVVVDEQTCRELDARISVLPDSRITFIRLTLLAGG